MTDASFITQALIDLVKINSVNPQLEKDGMSEVEIGNYIHRKLEELGFETTTDMLAPNRVNVVALKKGRGNGKSLMLNAHMDTVGVLGMSDPFGATIREGRLYGRGAYDMKGSIAAMLGVAKAVADKQIELSGDLVLSFVADEEHESIGAQALVKKIKTDACIVTEPTNLKICLGHRGFGIYEISTIGNIAHGGLHKEGIDANVKMGMVLSELNKLSKRVTAENKHSLCGEASLHVPLIQGGQSLFIYSGKCSIHVERRTVPGETEEKVLDELKSILEKLRKEDQDLKYTLKQLMWRNPYEINKDASIVRALNESLEQSEKSSYIGHTWWEDSALFGEAGIETVIIGPTGAGLHQPTEWVELDSVKQLSDILLRTAMRFCN